MEFLMRAFKLIFLSLAFALCAACSEKPSDDVLKWAIGEKHPSIGLGAIKMESYDITNSYTREVEGEEIFYYDYSVKVQKNMFVPNGLVNGSISLVKRGDKWYMLR